MLPLTLTNAYYYLECLLIIVGVVSTYITAVCNNDGTNISFCMISHLQGGGVREGTSPMSS